MMAEKCVVAVDAMGGDLAPLEIVKGAVEAVNENPDIRVILSGREEAVKAELAKYQYNAEQVEVVDAPEIIETGEPPVMAIMKKRRSSLVVAMNLVKDGKCDALVSAGSTGATLVGGQVIVGRLKGVDRPPLAPLMPTEKGCTLLIDCGANVDARPNHLVQFAKIGSIYMENVVGVSRPKVALVNIGTEEEKGNALVKETYPLLKNCPDINFIGNIEARDITAGVADVVVCEAFVGNIILKMYEGVAVTLQRVIKQGIMATPVSKIGGLLIRSSVKNALKPYHIEKYGGAPLLGCKGLVVKTHGNARAVEVKNSILQCERFKSMKINDKIVEMLSSQDDVADEGSDAGKGQ
jgi:glycerol-3-phosphate acyltransferase PlsX